MARAAADRAAERQQRNDPETWGINGNMLSLETADDVVAVRDRHRVGQVVRARRSDAFTLLHQGGGLTGAQFGAADRYVRDCVERLGVRSDDGIDQLARIQTMGAAELVTQRMIDAGRRIERAYQLIGLADVALLRALVEPMIRGEVRVWRAIVEGVTGEKERHAQAAVVRQACANLVLAYEAIDREELERRAGRRQPTLAVSNG